MLHSLGVPFFHHELVRQAAVLAIEKPAGTALLVELLRSLSDSGDLSPQQLHKGLTRCGSSGVQCACALQLVVPVLLWMPLCHLHMCVPMH